MKAGILVEHVDVLTDHLLGGNRQVLLDGLQGFRGGRVQVADHQILVGEHDVDRSLLHHRLDAGHLGFDLELLGDDRPSDHRADVILLVVVDGADEQVERFGTDLDVGLARQVLRITQQSPLEGRNLVEHVDVLTDHLLDGNRQVLLDRLQGFRGGRVHVADVEIEVREHNIDRRILRHAGEARVDEALIDGLGRVNRELHHFERLTFGIENRVVVGLNPDFLASLADPLVFGRLELPVAELTPELLVLRAVPIRGFDKQAVVLALDLVEPIAQRLQEVLIGRDDRAVQFELDDRLRLVDCRHLSGVVHELLFAFGSDLRIGVPIARVHFGVLATIWLGRHFGSLSLLGTISARGWDIDNLEGEWAIAATTSSIKSNGTSSSCLVATKCPATRSKCRGSIGNIS